MSQKGGRLWTASPCVSSVILALIVIIPLVLMAPVFCNTVKMGSSIDMSYANVRTTLEGNMFIAPATEDAVETNYEISVTEFVFPDGTSSPSKGDASAYMDVLIRESRDTAGGLIRNPFDPNQAEMHEQIRFREKTGVDGQITAFKKVMQFKSGFVR
jgi:hypothetical protein